MPTLNHRKPKASFVYEARGKTMDRNVVSWFQQGTQTADLDYPNNSKRSYVTGFSVIICTYKRAPSLKRLLDSLAIQDRTPDALIIVDASPDAETEQVVKNRTDSENLGITLLYLRVRGPLQGLTRQRNFGLGMVNTDLVAFFDDDVVFAPGCLSELEKTHRRMSDEVVGVGAYISNSSRSPSTLWRVRHHLRMVPSLEPGRYFGSGISVPWSFLPPTDKAVEVDCLPGCAMTWKTSVVRELGFHSGFDGYALGEDLDLSLRALRKGKLVLAGAAQLKHLHEPSGRPNHFKLGYMSIYNTYQIHRRGLKNRTWRDVLWFVYTWSLDTLLLLRHFVIPTRIPSTLKHFFGRFKATFDLIRGH
jgi:GT2 family glycosyltransferase